VECDAPDPTRWVAQSNLEDHNYKVDRELSASCLDFYISMSRQIAECSSSTFIADDAAAQLAPKALEISN
jgi:hypothetical protein